MRRGLALAAGVLVLAACSPEAGRPAGDAGSAGDPVRGQQVYLARCTVCHGMDPGRDGPVGPAIKGASRELLEARILRGAYPPGYQPKRSTQVMQPMPDLEPALPDLAAYLR